MERSYRRSDTTIQLPITGEESKRAAPNNAWYSRGKRKENIQHIYMGMWAVAQHSPCSIHMKYNALDNILHMAKLRQRRSMYSTEYDGYSRLSPGKWPQVLPCNDLKIMIHNVDRIGAFGLVEG